jgi:hypothetical protein
MSTDSVELVGHYEVNDDETQTANVNLITDLSFDRVSVLLASGASHSDAVSQAEEQLREALAIGTPSYQPTASGSQADINGVDTDDAYLMVVSLVLLQAASDRGGDVNEALATLLDEVRGDLADDGQIEPSLTEELDVAETEIDVDEVKQNMENAGYNAPPLGEVIDTDQDGDPDGELRACSPDSTPWAEFRMEQAHMIIYPESWSCGVYSNISEDAWVVWDFFGEEGAGSVDESKMEIVSASEPIEISGSYYFYGVPLDEVMMVTFTHADYPGVTFSARFKLTADGVSSAALGSANAKK